MHEIGIFEAKTRLSEICEAVAATRQPVTVTRRGRPLVRIEPAAAAPLTIRERREAYVVRHGKNERPDRRDFELPARARDVADFEVTDSR